MLTVISKEMDSSDSDTPISAKKTFKCTFHNCSASFSKNRKLLSHIRIHTGERPFVCDELGCDKTYTNSSHLRRHKKVSHGEKNAQKIVCDYEGCGLVLANKYSLKKHYNRKHNPEKYPFICTECKQGFYRKNHLQQHSYLHTGESAFSCDECDLSFTTNRNLNRHKRYHCVYDCDCGETFLRWSLMLAHKKLCKKLAFKCDTCDKKFSQIGNLKNHKLVHMNQSEKPAFACSYPDCKRSYFYRRNLKYHIDNFHKKINENRSYNCTYPKCKIILKTKQSLKMHLQRHFQWIPKMKRRPRFDKGKPKKSMVSVLLGEDHEIEEEQHQLNDTGDKPQAVDNQICISEEITDDVLLKQCDIMLTLLNERAVATN